jgi:hypothetical protein
MRRKKTLRECSPRTRLRVAMISVRFALTLMSEKHFLPLSANEFQRIRAAYFARSPVTSIEAVVELLRDAGVGCTFGECVDILTLHTTYAAGDILQWRAAERVATALKCAAYKNRKGGMGEVDQDVQVVFSALDEGGTGTVASGRVRRMLEAFELAPPSTGFSVPPTLEPDVGRMGRRSTIGATMPPEEMLNVVQFAQRYIQLDQNVDPHISVTQVGDDNESGGDNGEASALLRHSSSMMGSQAVGVLASSVWGASMRQQPATTTAEGAFHTFPSQIFGGLEIAGSRSVLGSTVVPPECGMFPAQTITSMLEKRIQQWSQDYPKSLKTHVLTTPRGARPLSSSGCSQEDSMGDPSPPRPPTTSRLYEQRSTLPLVSPRRDRPGVVGFSSSSQRFSELKPLPRPSGRASTRLDFPRHQVTMQPTPRRPQPPGGGKQYDLRRTDARLIGFGPCAY